MPPPRPSVACDVISRNSSSSVIASGRSSVTYEPAVGEQLRHARGLGVRDPDAQERPRRLHLEPGRLQRARARFEIGQPDEHRRRGRGREHVVDAPFEHELAAVDDRDAVAGVLDLGEQVARHEHGAALGAEAAQQLADLADAGRVEPVRRFVEHEQRRVLEQRGREAEPLLHAERVAAHFVVAAFGEADELEHRLDARRRDAVDRAEQPQVLAPRHRREQRGGLDDRTDARHHRAELARCRVAEDRRRAPPSVARARAGNGSSSSCPNRSDRGTRTRRLPEPRGRGRRPRSSSSPASAGTPCAAFDLDDVRHACRSPRRQLLLRILTTGGASRVTD